MSTRAVATLAEDVGKLLGGDPEAARDPYPLYDAMRAEAPAFPFGGSVILTSHELVKWAYLNPQKIPSARGRFIAYDGRFSLLSDDDRVQLDDMLEFEQFYISRRNADEHRRHRAAMQRAFTRPRIAAMERSVQSIVDDVVDEVAGAGETDWMEIAYRVPLLVIMDMLGAPREEAERVKWFGDVINEPNARIPLEPGVLHRAHAGLGEYRAYAGTLIERNRRAPGTTDLVSLLLDAEDDDRLTTVELVATFLHLLFAGHETTTNLLGNAVFSLLSRPDEWARVVADPRLAAPAVEEVLRFEAPVQFIGRVAGEDLELAGTEIAAGSPIILGDGPANRDPAAFVDPHRFDLSRRSNDHITFGLGAHFCIGAPVARLEARIALETLARRYPDAELAIEPKAVEWVPRTTFRGLRALPVRLGEPRG